MRPPGPMQPLDIVVLLKLASIEDRLHPPCGAGRGVPDSLNALVRETGLDAEAVTQALGRSQGCRLLDSTPIDRHSTPYRQGLFSLLAGPVRHVFPARSHAPLSLEGRGVPAAHSGPVMREHIFSPYGVVHVWPHDCERAVEGVCVPPLHPCVPALALEDASLHGWLSMTDSIRVGGAREINAAIDLLKKTFVHA